MGAVNIDNTGSGSAVTLSSNGTDLLLNGSAIGGGGGSSAITISNKTGAYTVVAGDLGKIINCTSGAFTVSLTAAATLGSGFYCWIWNTSSTSTDAITIDPSGSETIDGLSTHILRRGEGLQIVCDGTNFQTGDKKTMRGYAENLSSTTNKPVASGVTAISIGLNSTASGAQSHAFGNNTVASGTSSVAIGTSSSAASEYSSAIGVNSGANASQTATGAGAMALGGSRASGADSFAAAVANNTSSYGATGANGVAIGYLAKASGASSIAIAANSATASGSGSISIGGYNYGVTASAVGSIAIGDDCTASATSAISLGYGANSNVRGKLAYGARLFSAAGLGQYATFVIGCATTNATATVLTPDGSGGQSSVPLPNNSAYAFTGTVVARRQAAGGTESSAWKVEGLIRREGTAGSTTLVASTVTAISNVPGWTLALSADTTNGGLAVTATGAASTNIRWVATIQTSEVTYA